MYSFSKIFLTENFSTFLKFYLGLKTLENFQKEDFKLILKKSMPRKISPLRNFSPRNRKDDNGKTFQRQRQRMVRRYLKEETENLISKF